MSIVFNDALKQSSLETFERDKKIYQQAKKDLPAAHTSFKAAERNFGRLMNGSAAASEEEMTLSSSLETDARENLNRINQILLKFGTTAHDTIKLKNGIAQYGSEIFTISFADDHCVSQSFEPLQMGASSEGSRDLNDPAIKSRIFETLLNLDLYIKKLFAAQDSPSKQPIPSVFQSQTPKPLAAASLPAAAAAKAAVAILPAISIAEQKVLDHLPDLAEFKVVAPPQQSTGWAAEQVEKWQREWREKSRKQREAEEALESEKTSGIKAKITEIDSTNLTEKHIWNFSRYIYSSYLQRKKSVNNQNGYYNILNRGTSQVANVDDIQIISKAPDAELFILHCKKVGDIQIFKINAAAKTKEVTASFSSAQTEQFYDFIRNVAKIEGLSDENLNKVLLEGKLGKETVKTPRPMMAAASRPAGFMAARSSVGEVAPSAATARNSFAAAKTPLPRRLEPLMGMVSKKLAPIAPINNPALSSVAVATSAPSVGFAVAAAASASVATTATAQIAQPPKKPQPPAAARPPKSRPVVAFGGIVRDRKKSAKEAGERPAVATAKPSAAAAAATTQQTK